MRDKQESAVLAKHACFSCKRIQRFAAGRQNLTFPGKHPLDGRNRGFSQCFLRRMGRCASCFARVFMLAAPDCALLFVRTLPELAAIKSDSLIHIVLRSQQGYS